MAVGQLSQCVSLEVSSSVNSGPHRSHANTSGLKTAQNHLVILDMSSYDNEFIVSKSFTLNGKASAAILIILDPF